MLELLASGQSFSVAIFSQEKLLEGGQGVFVAGGLVFSFASQSYGTGLFGSTASAFSFSTSGARAARISASVTDPWLAARSINF